MINNTTTKEDNVEMCTGLPGAPRQCMRHCSPRAANHGGHQRIMTDFEGIGRKSKTNPHRKIALADAYKILIDRTNHEVLSLLHKWIKDNGGHPMESEMIRHEEEEEGDAMDSIGVEEEKSGEENGMKEKATGEQEASKLDKNSDEFMAHLREHFYFFNSELDREAPSHSEDENMALNDQAWNYFSRMDINHIYRVEHQIFAHVREEVFFADLPLLGGK